MPILCISRQYMYITRNIKHNTLIRSIHTSAAAPPIAFNTLKLRHDAQHHALIRHDDLCRPYMSSMIDRRGLTSMNNTDVSAVNTTEVHNGTISHGASTTH